VTASQRAQAAGLQLGIEQMRRRKNEAGGVCVWQFNEPWPAISWAIVDYFGRPKLAYERLRQWYRPLLLCLKFPAGRCWQAGQLFQAEIWAINDGEQAVTGELRISLDEAVIHTQALSVAANTLGQVGVLAHRLPARLRSIRLALHCEGEILAENFYDLDWCDPARGGFWHRLRRWVAEWVLW
jgi:beta-mannosidase